MCGSMCPPALAKLLGWNRGKSGQRGKRPENFLTAYEMEQLPTMLRELESANRHFWQMVCWRWSQQEQKMGKDKDNKLEKGQQQTGAERSPKQGPRGQKEQREEGGGGMLVGGRSPQERQKGCPDDSYTDGCALRELVRMLAKTMSEKGTFDAEAETMLSEFRARILGYRIPLTREKESKAERRRREFMKLRAISFNGGLGDVSAIQHGQQGQGQQEKQDKTSSSASASSSSSSGYSSGEVPNARRDRKAKASSWLRQRANSVRDRRGGRCVCCADNERLQRLGDLLHSEFHSTVFAHPTEFDVHERELKLLVWRRFTQMLVAIWSDRERFGADEKQR